MSAWPAIIRTVDCLEGVVVMHNYCHSGVLGAIINCTVIYFLWRRKYNSQLLAYRICITITSMQGILISGVVTALANTVHLFHYNHFLVIVYGLIATFDEKIGHFFIYFSLMTTACVWMLIPGSCLVQHLSLSKPHLSNSRKILLSYSICFLMIAWSTPYLLNFYPSPAFDETVVQAHRPADCDSFVALGGVLMPNKDHPKGILNFAVECIIPTYVISYGTFAFCVHRSRQALSSLDVKLSDRTLAMHRRFLMMLAMQNLLPLVVLSVPFTIFFIVVIGGYGMGLMTLIMSFSYWTLPIIQGSVALKFVLQATTRTLRMSLWPGIIRFVDQVEGAIGTALNVAVIYLLWRRKYSPNLLSYRICITITAIQGVLVSGVVVFLSNMVHLFHYDNFLIIVYGFIATFDEKLGRFLIYSSFYATFSVFQFIPGACLLQYFALCKPHLTTAKRFLFSYGPCLLMMLWSTPYYLSFHPAPSFDQLIRDVHQPFPSDPFVAIGAVLLPSRKHPKAIVNFALECVIPCYSISYGAFALCVLKCKGILSSMKLSEKTLAMHRKFLIMLALQNLLPLLVLSLPMGIFIAAVIGGLPMGLVTLVLSFSYWTLPIIQGSVALLFVHRVKIRSHRVHRTHSVTSIGRFLIYFSLFSTFCVWQLIPGACLLQYFTLCKPLPRVRRFIVSYGLCVVMLVWSTPYLLSFYPSSSFDDLVRTVHRPNACDAFVTMGSLLLPTDEHPKAMLNLAVECVIPTYAISYGIFAFCAAKCRGILTSLNIAFSEKTMAMHRKFLIMLALQNLLPLVVLSLPIGIFIVAVIGGYPMGLMTLVVSFSYWTLPVIQGSVALLFVNRVRTTNEKDRSKNMSFWPLFAAYTATAITTLGAAINVLVLVYLYRINIGGSWRVQVFVDDTYTMVVYGPVLLLPEWMRDAVFAAGAAHIYLMWQLIPAQSILQFCSLYRRNFSLPKRFLLAYSFVLLLVASSFYSCLEYIPTSGYARELRVIGRRAHNLTETDTFEVYGMPLFYTGRNEGRNMLFTIFVEICPSYTASYLLFGYCFYRVYRMVHNLREGISISPRSKAMHRTLLQLQFAQGSIPLLCTGTIISVSFICVASGLNIGTYAVLISLGLWSFSTVQGTMYLIYLRRTDKSRGTKIKNLSSNTKSNPQNKS
ncbi:hypothetical protein PRIPAC_85676 [Pristionchus pacificus]|uniref:G protein-coupled receptor n=1 Tax=Pristionchus pacificus TaxID=54126 RepID=A0A2A6BL77_PRIPA|nr:hypothetical protein PRIPAC_85676 [Pristionchus pacificus]|eukprot:PDM66670.1 G protein-coupled receptor [Pristionchus pacificus]